MQFLSLALVNYVISSVLKGFSDYDLLRNGNAGVASPNVARQTSDVKNTSGRKVFLSLFVRPLSKYMMEVPQTNLIINYMPADMSEKELYDLFVSYGKIRQHKIVRDRRTDQSLGYGFVVFASAISAEESLRSLNGLEIRGKRLKVDFARPRSLQYINTNLYISCLPPNVNEAKLSSLLSGYGTIVQLKILRHKPSGYSRGMAFVRFELHAAAQKALDELNKVYIFDGATRAISVQFARRLESEIECWEASRLESETEGEAPRLEPSIQAEVLERPSAFVDPKPENQLKASIRPRGIFFPRMAPEIKTLLSDHRGCGYRSPKLLIQMKILLPEPKNEIQMQALEVPRGHVYPDQRLEIQDIFPEEESEPESQTGTPEFDPELEPEVQVKSLFQEPKSEIQPVMIQIGIILLIFAYCVYINYTNN